MKKIIPVILVLVLFLVLTLSSCNTLEYIQDEKDVVNTVYTFSVIGALVFAYFKYK